MFWNKPIVSNHKYIMPINENDLSKLIETLTLIRDNFGEQKLLINFGPGDVVPLGSITFDENDKTITF